MVTIPIKGGDEVELRVLRYFLTLAREESISRAAEALYITQPTLSRQLAELEEELGVQLFERGKRKITLTQEGVLLRRRAEEMTELADKTERELRERSEHLAGVVSVGAAETVAAELLVRAVDSFRTKYPDVTFALDAGIADHVKERLDAGLLDLGLLIEPGDIAKYDFLRLGIDDRCGILMNAAAPLARKQFVTAEDLLGLPVVGPAREGVRQFYRNALGETFDRLNFIATFNLVNNAAWFARLNVGYVFTIEGTLRHFGVPELCFRPFAPELRQTTFLVWKKYQPVPRAVQAFIDEVAMLARHDNA